MKPLSHYIDAIALFIDRWNWTRVGLISDNSFYYHYAREVLLKRIQNDPYKIVTLTINQDSDIESIQAFKEYDAHIIVMIMDKNVACSVLEQAKKENFTWHNYAWILLSEGITCNDLMEGAFLMKFNIVEPSDSYEMLSINPEFERNVTYDAILAANFSHAMNTISNLTFQGLTSLVKFRDGKQLYNITLFQVSSNKSDIEVAYYDPEFKLLKILHDITLSGNFPSGNTVIHGNISSTASIVVAIFTFIVSILFVTVVLFLYIYFRNEPEVKATSVSVSLGIFLSCYLMLLHIPFLLIYCGPIQPVALLGQIGADVVCIILLWLSALGVPVILILSSLFVKMIRVYIIFLNPHSYKKKLCSITFLFLYILLLTLTHLLILFLWSVLVTFKSIRIEFPQKSHLLIAEACNSDNTALWLYLLLLYIIIVPIALIILALKSSKIRYQNFKDTKATNAFTFLTIFIVSQSLTYWYFILTLEPLFTHTTETLCVSHNIIVLPLLCQIYLFIPKVYPPLNRFLIKKFH